MRTNLDQPSLPNHLSGIGMDRIQHNVVFLRHQHRRDKHQRSLGFGNKAVADSPQGSRRWVLLPIFRECGGGCDRNLIRNFEGCDHKVIWQQRQVDVHAIFKDCKRAMGCCVANPGADARPAASKEERSFPVEGILAGEFPASQPVDVHLTHTAIGDAA